MRRFSVFTVLLLGLSALCFAQPGSDVLWSRAYGDSLDDGFVRLRPTLDGNLIAVGTLSDEWNYDQDLWLVKLTLAGDTLWTRCYARAYDDLATDVQPTPGGGYLMMNYELGGAMVMTKVDAQGAVEGEHVDLWLDGVHTGWLFPRADGGWYTAGGNTIYNEEVGRDWRSSYVRSWDADGNRLWSRENYSEAGILARSARRTQDGGWIFCGRQGLGPIYNFGYARRNAEGYLLWERAFPLPANCEGVDGVEMPDGGFLLCGQWTRGPGWKNIYLARTNASGDTLWTRRLDSPFSQVAEALEPAPDGGYWLGGTQNTAGGDNGLLIRLDADGDLIWSRSYGGSRTDRIASLVPEAGGCWFAGGTTSAGAGRSDGWIVRTGTLPPQPVPEQLVLWMEDDAWHLRWQNTGSPFYHIYAQPLIAGEPVLIDVTDDTTYTFPVMFHLPSCQFFVTGSTEE